MEFDYTLGLLPLMTEMMKQGDVNGLASFFLKMGEQLHKEELYLLCKEFVLATKVYEAKDMVEDIGCEIDEIIYGE